MAVNDDPHHGSVALNADIDRNGLRGSRRAGWYMVAVLTLLATISYLDRMVLNLLVDPVKRSLLLSDTQISLVQGLGFTIAYMAANPYLGRLSDRANRRNLLMAAAVMWSLGTAMTAFVEGMTGLLLCRMIVGAAEAAVQPASWSMLSDRFSPRRLPTVMSLFLISPYLGGGLALIFGGAVVESADMIRAAVPVLVSLDAWRLVFLIVGVGGIMIVASLLAVPEPHRSGEKDNTAQTVPSIRETFTFLYDNRAFFGNFYLTMSCIVVLLYAVPAWMPMFAARLFGISLATLGYQFGVVVLAGGTIGVLTGPLLVRMLDGKGVRASSIIVPTVCAFLLIPASIAIPFIPSAGTLPILCAVLTILFSMPQAVATSALQIVTPPRMRGLTASIYVLMLSVSGLGLAPLSVALLTDYMFADPRMVGWSLAIVCCTAATLASVAGMRSIGPYHNLLAKIRSQTH